MFQRSQGICFECSVQQRTGTDFSVAVKEATGQKHEWTFDEFLDGDGNNSDLKRNGFGKAKWEPDAGTSGRYYFSSMSDGVLPTCASSDDGWLEIKLQETNNPTSFGTGKFQYMGQTNGVCLYRFTVYCNCGPSSTPSLFPSLFPSTTMSPSAGCFECSVEQKTGKSLSVTTQGHSNGNQYKWRFNGFLDGEGKECDVSIDNLCYCKWVPNAGTFGRYECDYIKSAVLPASDCSENFSLESSWLEIKVQETSDPNLVGTGTFQYMRRLQNGVCLFRFDIYCNCGISSAPSTSKRPSALPSTFPSISMNPSVSFTPSHEASCEVCTQEGLKGEFVFVRADEKDYTWFFFYDFLEGKMSISELPPLFGLDSCEWKPNENMYYCNEYSGIRDFDPDFGLNSCYHRGKKGHDWLEVNLIPTYDEEFSDYKKGSLVRSGYHKGDCKFRLDAYCYCPPTSSPTISLIPSSSFMPTVFPSESIVPSTTTNAPVMEILCESCEAETKLASDFDLMLDDGSLISFTGNVTESYGKFAKPIEGHDILQGCELKYLWPSSVRYSCDKYPSCLKKEPYYYGEEIDVTIQTTYDTSLHNTGTLDLDVCKEWFGGRSSLTINCACPSSSPTSSPSPTSNPTLSSNPTSDPTSSLSPTLTPSSSSPTSTVILPPLSVISESSDFSDIPVDDDEVVNNDCSLFTTLISVLGQGDDNEECE